MDAVTRTAVQPDIDVAIVGAGLSGIGMAAHIEMHSPGRTYVVIERRDAIGGTWDLFRYPGIRSDSDMHTLGFVFEPWKHEKSIADGPAILEYLNRIADERGIRPHIRFGHKVLSADWYSEGGMWVLSLEGEDGERKRMTARFLYLGSGYYDYDDPYDAGFPGRETFKGEILHPQFWPKDFDHSGKRIVVIGSGATAVTIVPAMAGTAALVTMLQRTPTWIMSRPAKDAIANWLRRFLPENLAYRITRAKNIALANLMFKRSRNQPEKVKAFLYKKLEEYLGPEFDRASFTPPYNPWEQRLCFVPDADLFEAIKSGKAEIVTGHIDRFDETGILLADGRHLDADVIVTATGLKIAVAGKIALSLDGQPLNLAERFYYKGAMFSNVPNFFSVFGYLNASWTLRADIISEYACRVMNRMAQLGAQVATPVMVPGSEPEEDDIFDFSSGYIQRAKHIMPKSALTNPWRLNQDYLRDKAWLRADPIEDGILTFAKVNAPGAALATAR